MSTTLTCLLCAVSAIWVTAAVSRFRSTRVRFGPRYALPETSRQVAVAFSRLFSADESRWFEALDPEPRRRLTRQFKNNRRQVAQLYLQQVKREHDSAWLELRRLAARMDRPDLAREALGVSVAFNLRYCVLRLQLAAGMSPRRDALAWLSGNNTSQRGCRIASALSKTRGAGLAA
jgi:hypothetical protein